MLESLKGLNIVVFDLELKENPMDLPNKWQDFDKMGISSAVLYDFKIDRYLIYTDKNMQECADRINKSTVCVGFNQNNFDFKVIDASGFSIKTGNFNSIDIMQDIQRVLHLTGKNRKGTGLAPTGEANFGRGKIGAGAHAPQLFKEGKWGDLITYNLDDVALTRDLFVLAVKQGYIETAKGRANLNYREMIFGTLVC